MCRGVSRYNPEARENERERAASGGVEESIVEEGRVPRSYKVEIEPDEDGVYTATVPSVPGVAEQGESVDEALENLKKALAFHLETMEMEGEELPPSDAPVREIRNVELAV
jgi:antitoxin HicB